MRYEVRVQLGRLETEERTAVVEVDAQDERTAIALAHAQADLVFKERFGQKHPILGKSRFVRAARTKGAS